MDSTTRKIEFRIPISPTKAFYSQVRFFNYALRRLGGVYEKARLLVVVGGTGDIEAVIDENRWSRAHNIAWEVVPSSVFQNYGIHGTANWRLAMPLVDADYLILSDADTVLLRDIDALIDALPTDRAAIRGHMAHLPPPEPGPMLPTPTSPDYWPTVFEHFAAPWPSRLYHYSMDFEKEFSPVPAYFNLGFVLLNKTAADQLAPHIMAMDQDLLAVTTSFMRCQIALAILAARLQIDVEPVGAEYNAANDIAHLRANGIFPEHIRVLHYLRRDEIDRDMIFDRATIQKYRSVGLRNPANAALLDMVEEFMRARDAED